MSSVSDRISKRKVFESSSLLSNCQIVKLFFKVQKYKTNQCLLTLLSAFFKNIRINCVCLSSRVASEVSICHKWTFAYAWTDQSDRFYLFFLFFLFTSLLIFPFFCISFFPNQNRKWLQRIMPHRPAPPTALVTNVFPIRQAMVWSAV